MPCFAVPKKLSTAVLFGIGGDKPGVDDPRNGLIPVLRLAFGLYLQRRELDKGESFGFSTRLRPDTKRRTSANLPSCVFAAELLKRLHGGRFLTKARASLANDVQRG